MDQQKRAVIAIPIIVLIFICLWHIRREWLEKPIIKAITENKAFTDGWVTRILPYNGRGTPQHIYYIFTVNGKEYGDEKAVDETDVNDINQLYYNKHFPVIYSFVQVNKHDLLLNAEDSEKYDVH